MVSVTLKSTNGRNTAIVDENTATINSLYNDIGVDISGAKVSLDGKEVPKRDYDHTLAELGVRNDTAPVLSAVVKADGARG